MSERLDKALAALQDAANVRNQNVEAHLLAIARTQALIACAEALEQIAGKVT